ncbi:MAG: hypothetical protein KJO98_13560 [Rhodothermia bacterium]|nr:hypothetical protein [Rhodothermia bacterium]
MGNMSDHATHASARSGRSNNLRIGIVSGLIITLFTAGMMAGDAMNLVAQSLGFRLPTPVPVEMPEPPADRNEPAAPGILPTELEIHPDRLHADYLSPSGPESLVPADVAEAFDALAEMYRRRQAVDDNFTVRAYNIDTGEVLGVYTLESERKQFEETGEASWRQIDRKRRSLTKDVVESLVESGVPRESITVRWGRKNQILEARQRENRYIEYEVQLARYFGLSLLATEIGTVETFNNDRLVSRVGARSRYQMMPAMLRARSIHHYRLRTRGGAEIRVNEEWNPMLTMESAFIVARAYANAVGHEIPGISAYHTGPYNIFKLYREFLTAEGENFDTRTNVVAGYLWGLTHGYEAISSRSTFKTYSRGYLPSLYGALRATETIPIDTTQTMLAELVSLKEGESMFLSQLLEKLDGADERLLWRVPEDLSLYDRFREMNPHFDIPPGPENGSVPEAGDVYLVSSAAEGREPVRFFLPLGALAELRHRNVDQIDFDSAVTFDHDRFKAPTEPATVWDRLYADLVEDVRRFGFTYENRARLTQIVDKIEALKEQNITPYRHALYEVARLHERVWASNHFDKLAKVVPAARGRQRLPVQPLDELAGTMTPPAGSEPITSTN